MVARVEPALPGLPAPSITGQNTRTTIILYFFNCSLSRITRSNDHFFSLSISIRQVTKIHVILPLFSFHLPTLLLQTFVPRSFLSMHRGTEKHSYIVCNGCNSFLTCFEPFPSHHCGAQDRKRPATAISNSTCFLCGLTFSRRERTQLCVHCATERNSS